MLHILPHRLCAVIKKISIDQLNPGMFIHDLNVDWMAHPFLRKRFAVQDEAAVSKIRAAGIRDLYIDTSRGSDVPDALTEAEVRQSVEKEMLQVATEPPPAQLTASVTEELSRAGKIYEAAGKAVRDVMRDARLGKAIEVAEVEAVVEDITSSVVRNSGALISLLQLKTADDYTFLHCVAVGTLMVTFGRSLGLDAETVRQAGIGGLMHDLGKMNVPDEVLNKPGKLTDDEFALIKRHPEEGHRLLLEAGGVGPIPLDITLHHHERIDGSGYPERLPGDKISLLAKMSAIVDVYDAITSDRCYHRGMPPTDALRKMFEWSKFHFEEKLVHQFMRTIGIYPVGTLVKLESGRLAVVIEQTEGNLLAPKVRAFFSTRSNVYIPPEVLSLTQSSDRILAHELPEQWKVDPRRFL